MVSYNRYCKLRDEKGVKDSDVANGTGVTKSTFSDWKKGRSMPKQDKIQKIANYFGVSVDYFSDDGRERPDLVLTDEEREIILAYRKETPDKQESVRDILHVHKKSESLILQKEA